MKKFLLTLALSLFIQIGIAQTVYITASGKKYHSKNCPAVKTGKKGISLADARKQGYEPCKSCKADEIIEEKKTVDKKKKA